MLRRLDGRRTLQSVWDEVLAELRDDAPTQDEIVNLVGRLNAADLMRFDVTPDVAELLDRRQRREHRQTLGRLLNPLSLRMPLWDPDAFLTHLVRWLAPLPAWLVAAAWLALVGTALALAPPHWNELTKNFGERLMAADNLWLLAVAFPLLKAAHELAHGWAVKRRGGEVHEMGLMLLVFYPVPYVDASAASAFPDKRARMGVGAAGMLAEMALAAAAFLCWLALEPGLARSIAYNMIVVGGITTVLFNANPLLRYDGYFILVDWLEIPNLGQRATAHWQYLANRYLLGVASAEPPPATRQERRWFLAYAPLATAYRLSVTFGIAWFVAQHYFVVGVLLAAWALATGIVWPVLKAAKAIATQPQYTSRAGRVGTGLAAAAATLGAALFVVPLPHHTTAEGVVWLPEQALLRAGADGFVSRVALDAGTRVAPGATVVEMIEPTLQARLVGQQARVEEAEARLDAAWARPAEAGRLGEELQHERAARDRLADEAARLTVRPAAAGVLMLDRAADLPGRFLRRGDIVGHVIGSHTPYAKVVVAQDEGDRVRSQTRRVEVKLPQALAQTLDGRLVRAVPKASRELPSAALGAAGGGTIVTDPRDAGRHDRGADGVRVRGRAARAARGAAGAARQPRPRQLRARSRARRLALAAAAAHAVPVAVPRLSGPGTRKGAEPDDDGRAPACRRPVRPAGAARRAARRRPAAERAGGGAPLSAAHRAARAAARRRAARPRRPLPAGAAGAHRLARPRRRTRGARARRRAPARRRGAARRPAAARPRGVGARRGRRRARPRARAGLRGGAAQPRPATRIRRRSWARPASPPAASPRCRPARASRSPPGWPRRCWPAAACRCTWPPSTTTWRSATPTRCGRSSPSSASTSAASSPACRPRRAGRATPATSPTAPARSWCSTT